MGLLQEHRAPEIRAPWWLRERPIQPKGRPGLESWLYHGAVWQPCTAHVASLDLTSKMWIIILMIYYLDLL